MIKTLIRFPFVLLLLIAGALAYNDFRTWQTESQEPLKADLESKEAQITAKRRDVQRAQAFEEQKAQKLRELEQLASQLDSTRAEMPRNSSVPELLRLLADTSDKTGLEFASFRPSAQERREFLVVTPIDVVLKGTYVQIMSFLDTAANLTRIVSAQNLKMDLPNTSRTSVNVLTATARLVTYHLDENYSPAAAAPTTTTPTTNPVKPPAPGGGGGE